MLSHLDPFRRRSVALALYRMLTGHRFDVCVVRQALDVAGVDPPRADFEALRLHHCARYAEMPGGFHAEVASQTLALLASRPVSSARAEDGLLDDLAAAAGMDPNATPHIAALTLATAHA